MSDKYIAVILADDEKFKTCEIFLRLDSIITAEPVTTAPRHVVKEMLHWRTRAANAIAKLSTVEMDPNAGLFKRISPSRPDVPMDYTDACDALEILKAQFSDRKIETEEMIHLDVKALYALMNPPPVRTEVELSTSKILTIRSPDWFAMKEMLLEAEKGT